MDMRTVILSMVASSLLIGVASATVNLSDIWTLIDDVVAHTSTLVGLVILGVVMTVATIVGVFITRVLMNAAGRTGGRQ